jgi:hypothetical protein
MKYCVISVVCFLLILTIRLNATPSQTLEKLTSYEKSNAVINIECEETAQAQANLIEETWNNGNYEEAIELLRSSPKLDDAAIGIQWKNPIKTSSRWAGDVRVGTVDSVVDMDFDIDNSNGNLLAALLYRNGPSNYRFTINMSQDTGKTWSETYVWTTSSPNPIDIDCAVYKNHFYLAYTYTNNTEGRIRRFSTSDGSADMTYGAPNGFRTVIHEGDSLREIVLISDADNSASKYLFYLSIMASDSLRLYFNYNDTSAISWTREVNFYNLHISDADRGLDACYTVPNKLWTSYIGTDNSPYAIGGWASWTVHDLSSFTGTHPKNVTSVAAYGDTVMVVYHYDGTTFNDVRYSINKTGGTTNWAVGVLLTSTSDISYVNDVTARGGDGFGTVYQTIGGSAVGVYQHRSYSSSFLTPPDSFADNVPCYDIKPCIERIADGVYGILYVNWPGQMAWFDRSDWPSGIDEDLTNKNTAVISSTSAVFSNKIEINYYLPANQDNSKMSLDIYNIAGERIKNLAKGMPAGRHSVTWFGDSDGKPAPNGIYFAVLKSGEPEKRLKITLIR